MDKELATVKVWRNEQWQTVRLFEIGLGEIFVINNIGVENKYVVAQGKPYLNDNKVWTIAGQSFGEYDGTILLPPPAPTLIESAY